MSLGRCVSSPRDLPAFFATRNDRNSRCKFPETQISMQISPANQNFRKYEVTMQNHKRGIGNFGSSCLECAQRAQRGLISSSDLSFIILIFIMINPKYHSAFKCSIFFCHFSCLARRFCFSVPDFRSRSPTHSDMMTDGSGVTPSPEF